MERHGRNLEGDTCKHEHQTEHQTQRAVVAGNRRGNLDKPGKAGVAVDQRSAVQQKPRRQGTENKIFKARFSRPRALTVDRSDHVERQRLQFHPHIERNQVIGRNHQQHAQRCQHDENRKLELVDPLRLGVANGHHHCGDRTDQHQHLHEARERIGQEGPVIGFAVAGHQHQHQAGGDQQRHGQPVDEGHRLLAGKHTHHQQQHGTCGQHELGHRKL